MTEPSEQSNPEIDSSMAAAERALTEVIGAADLGSSPILAETGASDRKTLIATSILTILLASDFLKPSSDPPEFKIFEVPVQVTTQILIYLLFAVSTYALVAFSIACFRSWQRWSVHQMIWKRRLARLLTNLNAVLSAESATLATTTEAGVNALNEMSREASKMDRLARLRDPVRRELEAAYAEWERSPSPRAARRSTQCCKVHIPANVLSSAQWPALEPYLEAAIDRALSNARQFLTDEKFNSLRDHLLGAAFTGAERQTPSTEIPYHASRALSEFLDWERKDYRPVAQHLTKEAEGAKEQRQRIEFVAKAAIRTANMVRSSSTVGFIWDLLFPVAIYGIAVFAIVYSLMRHREWLLQPACLIRLVIPYTTPRSSYRIFGIRSSGLPRSPIAR